MKINKSGLSKIHHIYQCNKVAFEASVEHYYSIIYVTFAKNVLTRSSGSAFRGHVLLFVAHLIQVFGIICIRLYAIGWRLGDVVCSVTTLSQRGL